MNMNHLHIHLFKHRTSVEDPLQQASEELKGQVATRMGLPQANQGANWLASRKTGTMSNFLNDN